MRRTALLSAWMLSASVALAATLDSSLIQTSGLPSVGSGKFYGYQTATIGPGANAFSNAYDRAMSEGVPLVVIWSDSGCSHCDAFIDELNSVKEDVGKWLASKTAVFSFFKDALQVSTGAGARIRAYHSGDACWDAWNFAANTCDAKATWPLFAFYYKNGSVIRKWGTATDNSGATRTWERFKTEYESWAKKYGIEYQGGDFVASGTEFDRYEAEPATTNVDVELVRDASRAGYSYRNSLVAIRPGETEAWLTNDVVWAASETAKTVRVSLVRAEGEEFREGEITLRLLDRDGRVHASTPIACRKSVANSNINPLWVGERTAESLAWGEWTMDLDVATNKAAAAEGAAYTLVCLQGSQWCPDCANTDANFLDLMEDGKNRFSSWAMARNIALAVVDVPNYGARSGTEPETCASPSLLSKKAYQSRGVLRSGLGYLSRKMVPDDDAKAMRARNHFLASANTSAGGFHRPEDTNIYRTGIPVFVLLRKDGSVAARLVRFSNTSPKESDRAKWGDYIRRFDEMLGLASEADEIGDNHWTTTGTTMSSAKPIKASISHVDTFDVAEIVDASAGAHLRLSLAGESTNAATLAIMSVKDGEARTVGSAYGPIGGLSVEADLVEADRWFASVSCANTAAGFAVDEPSSTIAEYTLSEECYIQPQEKAETNVPDGGVVRIRVVEGELYRLAGVVLPTEELLDAGDGLYRAARSGDITLSLSEGATSVTYQLWHPGEVRFVKSEQTVYTHTGDAAFSLVREGGVSGRRQEVVRLLSHDGHSEGRYAWANDVPVVWEDGEGGEKTVVLGIVPPGDVVHSAGRLEFGAGDSRLVVTLLDTDSPGLALLDYEAGAYRYFSSGISFPAVNLVSGNHVSVRVLSGALPGGTRLAYDESTGDVKLLGEPVAAGKYEFTVSLAEIRDDRYVAGPASTIRVKVEAADEINPFLAMARPSETLPLYADRDGTNYIAGTLSASITSRCRIAARYAGTEARALAFSGSWQKLDRESGTVSATLEQSGCRLDLEMDDKGEIHAMLRVSGEFTCFAGDSTGLEMSAAAEWPKEVSFEDYAGLYNIVLPPAGGDVDSEVPSGIGMVALRMARGSAARSGRFSYSGFMPDGTPLAGSANAVRHSSKGEEFIYVPVFRRIGKNCFSAVFAIRPRASEKWESADPIEREVAGLAEGTMALSIHRDAAWSYEISHVAAVGSYYREYASPLRMSEEFYGALYGSPVKHRLRFGVEGVRSPKFGALSAPEVDIVPGADAMEMETNTVGMSFRFTPRSGMFMGSATLTFTDGGGARKKVTGLYRGLLTPGWIRECDCGTVVPEWYFGSGFLRYRDFNESGRAVMKSIPVMLAPGQYFEE